MNSRTVKAKTKKPAKKKAGNRIDNLQRMIMFLPGLILVIVFAYLPMIGVVMAFKKYNPNLGIFGSKWVGLDNFRFFIQSSDFIRIFRNTILYSFDFMIVTTIANVFLAILFYNVTSRKALKYYQTTAIFPSFMSTVLVSYIVYAFLNPTSGFVNRLIEFFGGTGVDWYAEGKAWPFILNVVKVWNGIGVGSLYYYAAMLGIDESLFEAARIDGANKAQEVRYIIIPEITGLICIFLILGVGGLMNGDFGLHYQVTRNQGVLYPATDIIQTYVFRATQTGSSMGRTAAIGLFSSVCGTVLVVVTNLIVRRIDPEKSLF